MFFEIKYIPREPISPLSSEMVEGAVEVCAEGRSLFALDDGDAKDLALLMSKYFDLATTKGVNELSDRELLNALRERGYSGKLTLKQEIDL